MKTRYRYDRATGQMIGEDGMPMLNQSERSGPPVAAMVISDTQPALQSMVTGNYHDSKSNMRREYKQHGVEEIGSESKGWRSKRTWTEEKEKRKKQREGIKASLHKAHSRLGYGAP